MTDDWKDALAALRGSVPQDNTPDPEPRPGTQALQRDPLRVVLDRKGRKGKTATVVEGWLGDDATLEEMARQLKQRLGTGGSVRGGEILIQGDRKKEVTDFLRAKGLKVC